MTFPPRRQRGVALLVALLVVALAVILIAALLDRGELALARTRNLLRGEQAEAYAQGLELYAAQVLTAADADGVDSNTSAWAVPLPPQPVPGGTIGATMRDLNGCFNLNNLAPAAAGGDPDAWQPVFERLLGALHLVDAKLAPALRSWLDANADDADAAAYLALPVPYRPRRGAFVHVSELRLVAGVGDALYAALAPYVCALPPGTTINPNTASVPVLMSIAPEITQAIAEKIWNDGHASYVDADALAAAAGLRTLSLPPTMYAFRSRYFLARGEVVLDAVPFTFFSLIERGDRVRVVERSRGSDDALAVAAPVASGDAAAAAR
ncbi:MAG TPA: type II secretion system minor pseudopilin GspK [Dokdonella sp.]